MVATAHTATLDGLPRPRYVLRLFFRIVNRNAAPEIFARIPPDKTRGREGAFGVFSRVLAAAAAGNGIEPGWRLMGEFLGSNRA